MNALTYRTYLLPLAPLQHGTDEGTQAVASPDANRDEHSAPLRLTRFSRDGHLVMAASSDGRVRFWDGRTEAGVAVPRGIYLIRLQAGRWVGSRKVVVTRE